MSPLKFYQTYNTTRLHFTKADYDVLKYGFKNRNFDEYHFFDDPLKKQYVYIAQTLANKPDMTIMDIIVGNFIAGNNFITDFDFDSGKVLIKYNANKIALIEDFESEISKSSFADRYNSGSLANEVLLGHSKIELWCFVNKLIGLIDESKAKIEVSASLESLLYGNSLSRANDSKKDFNIFYKLAPFCRVPATQQEDLQRILQSLLDKHNLNRESH